MTQDEALDILKTGANVFLTGEPGSGKTHTVNRYVAYLRDHGVRPSITASTGIAATHISGMTIHSWSGIGIRPQVTAHDLERISTNERTVKRVRNAKVLIIDEVSMLAAGTLSMVDAVCRALRDDETPFGGLQVVLVGDFFQLPPVVARSEEEQDMLEGFEDDARLRGLFAFASPLWDSLECQTCYLTEQHRQEDEEFLQVLNAIRSGSVSAEHVALLDSRRAIKPKQGMTQLFSHNADVDRINERELSKLMGEAHAFEMESHGPPSMLASLKKGCLSPETLRLKIGAKVMFTKNNFEEGYVNGTLGTVTGFTMEEGGRPLVTTRNGRVITASPVEWTIEDGGKVLARIQQIPLRLAWAMTVHKSQGMSLDEAFMDLSRTFEYGQGYVALSRIRTLAGLLLGGLNDLALEVHPSIRKQDITFRDASRTSREALQRSTDKERVLRHHAFLRACGGTVATKQETSKDSLHRNVKNSSSAKADRGFMKIRESNPNAYLHWSDAEDADLKRRFAAGEKIKDIAEVLGRRRGAISSRLAKLGLS